MMSSLVDTATQLGRLLASRGEMIATAESCTGGLVAWALTETAGSSAWFEQSTVTYSNAAKIRLLAVRPATLQAHGAVSEQCALEMALGAKSSAGCALALSVTGIAGPSGATPGKPVGMVCFGLAYKDLFVSLTRQFAGDRAQVREQAAQFVLQEALKRAEEVQPNGLGQKN